MTTTFPPLSEKEFERLPEVFREIIKYDAKDPRLQKVVVLSNAQEYLEEVRDWKVNRNNLTEGARRNLQKQRGGPANA